MDALGVETAALLGHSAGAPVALDAALVAPDRVKSYIAVAPAVFLGDPPEKKDEDGGAKKGSSGGGLRPLRREALSIYPAEKGLEHPVATLA
jgi:pimeloyl-ACP methyl ester carboxylesterase